MPNQLSFFATCAQDLSGLLFDEISQLGCKKVKETRGGVFFEGSITSGYLVCLWSRLASRVLLLIDTIDAPGAEDLRQGVSELSWDQHLSNQSTFAVSANVSRSTINHSHFAALIVKDGVADFFSRTTGSRPDVETKNPDIQLNCYLKDNQASIYLDLSGTSLHQRGYRLERAGAPMRETLAAAILIRAGWSELASTGAAFVDLLCGAGTLPIEAAMIAADIAPGLDRHSFGFLKWHQHDDEMWQTLLSDARQRKQAGLQKMPVMFGFDASRRALSMARENAQRADLSSHIQFEYQDLTDFRHDLPKQGLVVSNPPYGRRMGSEDDLKPLYMALGNVLRTRCVDWDAAIFTADQDLGKAIGIRTHKIHNLKNGKIDCKLLRFKINESNYFGHRRLPRLVPEAELSDQARMFANRLRKNVRGLQKWRKREHVTCYRVYDADLPDYNVAVDVYEDVNQTTFLHIQEYAPPPDIEKKKTQRRLQEALTVIREQFQCEEEQVFLKIRQRQRGIQQYEKLEDIRQFHKVMEGSCQLRVNFEDYLDTGLFLDHRPLRLRIADTARGKSVLNLFSYTGAVTVHAGVGGATTTTSVDMSKTYLDWTRENLILNNLDRDQHHLVQADCIAWLEGKKDRRANISPGHYDLIVVDPPSFSNSRRMEDHFDIQRDHTALIKLSMAHLNPEGELYFSCNLRSFKLSSDLVDLFKIEDISQATIPPDFQRGPLIHRCWIIRHKSF